MYMCVPNILKWISQVKCQVALHYALFHSLVKERKKYYGNFGNLFQFQQKNQSCRKRCYFWDFLSVFFCIKKFICCFITYYDDELCNALLDKSWYGKNRRRMMIMMTIHKIKWMHLHTLFLLCFHKISILLSFTLIIQVGVMEERQGKLHWSAFSLSSRPSRQIRNKSFFFWLDGSLVRQSVYYVYSLDKRVSVCIPPKAN